MNKTTVIIGATSAIAQAFARQVAPDNTHIIIVGRNAARLNIVAEDLQARGCTRITTLCSNLEKVDQIQQLFKTIREAATVIDTIVIAHGSLSDQTRSETDLLYATNQFTLNATSVILCTQLAANILKEQNSGTLAVIGSVAGDRGRKSNYFYGAAKGAIDIFLAGLRHSLDATPINVLTIKPGFVDTPMTSHLPKGPLFASPEKVAKDICNAIDNYKSVLYTPFFWRYIMLIIRNIPTFIFNKTQL